MKLVGEIIADQSGATMAARVWPISHLRSSGLFAASVLIFAVLLFSLQLALGQFTQGSKLVGTGAAGNAQQGISVALSGDGNTAIVGGPHDNPSAGNNSGAGAAWVFTQSSGVWTQRAASWSAPARSEPPKGDLRRAICRRQHRHCRRTLRQLQRSQFGRRRGMGVRPQRER